jgi:hypothetical protein
VVAVMVGVCHFEETELSKVGQDRGLGGGQLRDIHKSWSWFVSIISFLVETLSSSFFGIFTAVSEEPRSEGRNFDVRVS